MNNKNLQKLGHRFDIRSSHNNMSFPFSRSNRKYLKNRFGVMANEYENIMLGPWKVE